MAESSKDKQTVHTDDLGRKVWDKEFYAKRAAVRQYEDGLDFGEDDVDVLDGGKSRKKARKETSLPAERRPLEQRKETVQLDVELGKSRIVTTHTPKQQQGGYWCDVCECLIKDSQAYLDHINGKRHNRLLGMTMRVERVGVDRVKTKIEQIKQVRNQSQLTELELTRLKSINKENVKLALKYVRFYPFQPSLLF